MPALRKYCILMEFWMPALRKYCILIEFWMPALRKYCILIEFRMPALQKYCILMEFWMPALLDFCKTRVYLAETQDGKTGVYTPGYPESCSLYPAECWLYPWCVPDTGPHSSRSNHSNVININFNLHFLFVKKLRTEIQNLYVTMNKE